MYGQRCRALLQGKYAMALDRFTTDRIDASTRSNFGCLWSDSSVKRGRCFAVCGGRRYATRNRKAGGSTPLLGLTTSTELHERWSLQPNTTYNMNCLTARRATSALARSTCIRRPLLNGTISQYGRLFSTSAWRSIAVAEMSKQDLNSLKIKQDRLMKDIHSTCEWGKGERWGE